MNDRLAPRNVFAYWDSPDHAILSEMEAAWSAGVPRFRVLGDADIVPLLARLFPSCVDLYQSIRIPAAKSDIARLLALYEWGGLYIDCHCGIGDIGGLVRLFDRLDGCEAILFDRSQSFVPRPPGEHFLLNGPILGRKASPLLLLIAAQALANLAWQWRAEREHGFVAYRIPRLTGPMLVTEMVLQPGSCNRDVRADFANRIMIVPEEAAPVRRGCYRAYTTPGNHWSERETSECLFASAAPAPPPSPALQCHNFYQAEIREATLRALRAVADLRRSSSALLAAIGG